MKKSAFYLLAMGLCAAAFLPLTAAGETFSKASDWIGRRTRLSDGENGVVKVSLPVHIMLKPEKSVRIEPGKVYTLSGEFRYTGEGSSRPLMLGFTAYNGDGRVIERVNVNRASSMLPNVAVDAPKGASSVELKGALQAWAKRTSGKMARTARNFRLAFGAAADGSDLPNYRVSGPIKAESVVRLPNGNWQITFDKPLEFEVKAGEAAALHHIGMSYMYIGKGKALNGEWTKFSGSYSTAGKGEVQKFYPAAVTVGAAVTCPQRGKGTIEFRNISITEVE